ncbi:MAG: TIGR03000 domain-containing protein [Planctomycetes bacterium]|nr:TIGR03000 domain-containing protein [Planctomycetota bacterium]
MRQVFAIFALIAFTPASFAQDVFWAPGTTTEQLGGIVFMRDGGQTTLSIGGILFGRRVKQTERTPVGPVVTRFVLPSALHSPYNVPLPGSEPASLQLEMPDQFGIIYIDGELVRSHGKSRQLATQPLAPGKEYPVKLRAAFAVGNQLLIQEKMILLRAGHSVRVNFDGQQAVAVTLPTAVRQASK